MHDASIILCGNAIDEHFEELQLIVDAISEEEDQMNEITNASMQYHESHIDRTPNGETVEVPPAVMIFFWIDTKDSIDYAKENNSMGLEADLNHLIHKRASDELLDAFDFDASLDRTKRCDHPDDEVEATDGCPDFCNKCGGPAVEVAE